MWPSDIVSDTCSNCKFTLDLSKTKRNVDYFVFGERTYCYACSNPQKTKSNIVSFLSPLKFLEKHTKKEKRLPSPPPKKKRNSLNFENRSKTGLLKSSFNDGKITCSPKEPKLQKSVSYTDMKKMQRRRRTSAVSYKTE